jgi:hypothetical protein
MATIFGRLGFNSGDPTTVAGTQNYNTNVINQMNLMPPMLNSWQTTDIANSNVGGYFQNPVATVAQNIMTFANSTYVTANSCNGSSISTTITGFITSIVTKANTIGTVSGPNYLYITNRQSNVVDIGTDTTTPHYTIAIGTGKILSYITNASDGIQNTAPIMGSFTSITLANQLNSLYSTLGTYGNIFINSIDTNTGFSNITLNAVTTLSTTINSISNLFTTYPAQDTAFFNNAQAVLSDYGKVSQFSKLGQTENYLLNNYIGTPKLLSRIS